MYNQNLNQVERLRMDDSSDTLMNNNNVRIGGNINNNYVPLNVEDGSSVESKPISNSISEASAANEVKTMILILVWYIFSLFLTIWPLPFTVVPTAVATALDINLSNVSLVFISVTFATMCKSAAPIFLLLFAFAFRLETPSLKLFGIILVISIGVLLTVAKETEFDILGFIFVMFAAVMSGFRWCMTQILLQREDYGLKNPLVFISFVTPVMAITTAVFSALLDPWYELPGNQYFDSSRHIMKTCLLLLFGGALAFFMVLAECFLVSVTSAVTVTIAGIVKEAVTIIVAVFYFHDDFTWLKGFGLVTIMVGVSLFNWYKYQKLKEGEATQIIGEGSAATKVPGKYAILEESN